MLVSLSNAVSPWVDKPLGVCDAWPVRRQTYGYLRRASPRSRAAETEYPSEDGHPS